jgi:hypothetical protein
MESYTTKMKMVDAMKKTTYEDLMNYWFVTLRHQKKEEPMLFTWSENEKQKCHEWSGYDFKNMDDLMEYVSGHSNVVYIKQINSGSFIVWMYIQNENPVIDHDITWRWGGYEQHIPATLEKTNTFMIDKMFQFSSGLEKIEMIMYQLTDTKKTYYTPYLFVMRDTETDTVSDTDTDNEETE